MLTPVELSPITKCLRIAAARGRAIRLQREQAGVISDEVKLERESGLVGVIPQADDRRRDDDQTKGGS